MHSPKFAQMRFTTCMCVFNNYSKSARWIGDGKQPTRPVKIQKAYVNKTLALNWSVQAANHDDQLCMIFHLCAKLNPSKMVNKKVDLHSLHTGSWAQSLNCYFHRPQYFIFMNTISEIINQLTVPQQDGPRQSTHS